MLVLMVLKGVLGGPGGILEGPGGVLGGLGIMLGRAWVVLGGPAGNLGGTPRGAGGILGWSLKGDLGDPWGLPRNPWGFHGRAQTSLGRLGGCLGGSLGVLRCFLGASKNIQKTLIFVIFPAQGRSWMILGAPWGCPGADLEGSWGLLGAHEGVLRSRGKVLGGYLGGPWGSLRALGGPCGMP